MPLCCLAGCPGGVQLAPLMDGGLLVLEGIMPSNQRNAYTLPLDLYFYGAGGPWGDHRRSAACVRTLVVCVTHPNVNANPGLAKV
jgi:hypothetical protein